MKNFPVSIILLWITLRNAYIMAIMLLSNVRVVHDRMEVPTIKLIIVPYARQHF